MNKEIKENYHQKIKEQNQRLTKPRKTILNILEKKHLTFKEIQSELALKGFLNVASIYNNLLFFINNKTIAELYIDGEKYYELTLTNPNHDASSHLHFIDTEKSEITEVFAPEVFEFIKNFDELKKKNITAIKIIVEGTNLDK